MLDVIFPVQADDIIVAERTIQVIEDLTDVPVRLIVVVDGGSSNHYAPLESWLKGMKSEFVVLHNAEMQYLNSCIRSALPYIRSEYAALIPADHELLDDQWFGKMQAPFIKDPQAFVVDGQPNTKSSTQAPARRSPTRVAEGTRFALLRSKALIAMGAPLKDEEPVTFWSRQAFTRGGTSWVATGARYTVIDTGKEHMTWRAKSVGKARSGSRSRTTQGSSTATTTDKGGFAGFVP